MLSVCTILSSCFTSKNSPQFPKNINRIIEETAEKTSTPDWHIGQFDTVVTEELSIHFESIGDKKNPTILLIMGYGTPGLAWTTEFIQPLLDASFHVIRFDNRDTGRTRWLEGKDPEKKTYYQLTDMASDAKQILDHLGKEKAHVVGISMGGMIGQQFAIDHPERLLSLTCLASTGYYFDPKLVSVSGKVIRENIKLILKYGVNPKSFVKEVKKRMRTVSFLRNDKIIDEEMVIFSTQRILFKKQNDYINNPAVNKRHAKAIRLSGSRLAQLKEVENPVLLIHGTADVLIGKEHTEKYATYLPHKKEVYIENMGHIPTIENNIRIANEILIFLEENKHQF